MIELKVIHVNHGELLASQILSRTVDMQDPEIQAAFEPFENIVHRLERFACTREIQFINDSKATNINSTWYSLESIENPIIWIAGGVERGNDWSQLRNVVSEKVKAIVCIGVDNKRIVSEFKDIVPIIEETVCMNEAVRHAYYMAKPGDVVILSPACASFDLFENYEHRGNSFKTSVFEL